MQQQTIPSTPTIVEVTAYKKRFITLYNDGSASFSGLKFGSVEKCKKKIDAMEAIKIIDGR